MAKTAKKPTVYISGAHLAANQLFAKATALKLVPPPKNETVEDLNAHIREVLAIDTRRKMVDCSRMPRVYSCGMEGAA